MIASLNDVVKRFGSLQALDHVSFEIEKGEILGLLGPNGAGKTTAIRALAGLIETDSGEITLFGEKQNIHNIQLKQNIGLVTQEVTVFEELTAEENLYYFGGLYGLRGSKLRQRVQETLEFVGLVDHAKGLPRKFSGGMKRRLNIGCALVHEPQFLIMDEPTVGIDPQSRNYILESVRKLAESGTTILYTSHYMEEVQAIASRIVIMDQGHVIAGGTLNDLITHIQHVETINITAVHPSDKLTEGLEAIQGVKSVTREGADYTIVSTAGSGNLNRIMHVALQNGGISNISIDKPGLEDVFLTLTGKKLRDEEENMISRFLWLFQLYLRRVTKAWFALLIFTVLPVGFTILLSYVFSVNYTGEYYVNGYNMISSHIAVGMMLLFQLNSGIYILSFLENDFMKPMKWRLKAVPCSRSFMLTASSAAAILFAVLQGLLIVAGTIFIADAYWGSLWIAVLVVIMISVTAQLLSVMLLFITGNAGTAEGLLWLLSSAMIMLTGFYFDLPDNAFFNFTKKYATPVALANSAIIESGFAGTKEVGVWVYLAALFGMIALLYAIVILLGRRKLT
jgi:ABC-2 type transport system ATP-binding protein